MEPRAKKAYFILSFISILIVGVVVLLAFLNFPDPIIVVVPAAVGAILIITIMWLVFIRIRQKERADFVLAKKHRLLDEGAPEYKSYDLAKATASKEAIYCEYCEARMEPTEDICSNCGKKKDRFAGMKLT